MTFILRGHIVFRRLENDIIFSIRNAHQCKVFIHGKSLKTIDKLLSMSLNYTLETKKKNSDLYFEHLIFRQKLSDKSRITESQLIAYLLTNIS